MIKILTKICLLSLLVSVTTANGENIDPIENINRTTHNINTKIDNNVLSPITKTYKENIPEFTRNRVGNFVGNLQDVSTLANQLLQFKLIDGVTTLSRIAINSTIGLGGLFDIATDMNLQKKHEDFGQTMAVWGVAKGPYLVLPILGPSNLRDALGMYVDVVYNIDTTKTLSVAKRNTITALEVVDKRVKLSPTFDLINNADDPYISMRSLYLQKRDYDVNDEYPKEEEF